MTKYLVLGGPGAGKTERLLGVVEAALDAGQAPNELAFVAFTNAAADEARERASVKFGIEPKRMPYFRTIHSLCFRALGLRRGNVIGRADLQALADLTDERLSATMAQDWSAGEVGDRMLHLDHHARATMQTLRDAWGEKADWDWHRQLRFSEAYKAMKLETGKLDFTDMLSRYVTEGRPIPVSVAVVDEGQDLTPLQWAVIEAAFSSVDDLWVGGDDDQAIHSWAGADVDKFLSLAEKSTVEVLPLSYRLPQAVFDIGEKIVAQLRRRYAKERRPSPRKGSVAWYASPEEIDLSHGSWLLLARTTYQLDTLAEIARRAGVVYTLQGRPSVLPRDVRIIQAYEALRAGKAVDFNSAELVAETMLRSMPPGADDDGHLWTATELDLDCSRIWHDALLGIDLDDREYYLACRRRGESLTGEPRVRISTIHGAKGRQADNVVLLTDLTPLTHGGYLKNPDDEHRVFYVGATRALEGLHLIVPQGAYGYAI